MKFDFSKRKGPKPTVTVIESSYGLDVAEIKGIKNPAHQDAIHELVAKNVGYDLTVTPTWIGDEPKPKGLTLKFRRDT